MRTAIGAGIERVRRGLKSPVWSQKGVAARLRRNARQIRIMKGEIVEIFFFWVRIVW